MLNLLLALGCSGDSDAGDGVKSGDSAATPGDSARDSAPTDSGAGGDSTGGDSARRDSGFQDSSTTDSAVSDSAGGDTADSGAPEEIPAGDWVWVEAGAALTCGIHADGSIECFGRDDDNIVADAPAGSFVAMAVTGSYACALDGSGAVQCWGDGAAGLAPDSLPPAVAVSCEWYQIAYALGTDGTLATTGECRGPADCGEPPSGTYEAIEAGAAHACALDASGEAICWGEMGDEPPAGPFVDLSAALGALIDCALDASGEVVCWGSDYTGRWGEYVPPAGPFVSIDVGVMYACALDAAGSASCWRAYDEYDDFAFFDPPDYPLLQISAGDVHACGITTLGGMACWGLDVEGSTEPP